MAAILFVAFLGLVLIYVEFFLPGGFLAILGAGALLVSVSTFLFRGSSLLSLFFYLLFLLLSIFFTLRLAFKRLKKSEGSLVSSASQESGYSASSLLENSLEYSAGYSFLGREGEALTDLRPAGFVAIEGQRKTAISYLGYIDKGTAVRVVQTEGSDLIVREL